MNIINPVSILSSASVSSNVTGSAKHGEGVPTSSHVDQPSLMGTFSRLATTQDEGLGDEMNKQEQRSTSSSYTDVAQPTDSDIDAKVDVIAISSANTSNEASLPENLIVMTANPKTEKEAVTIHSSEQIQSNSKLAQTSPFSLQLPQANQERMLNIQGMELGTETKPSRPQEEAVKVNLPRLHNDNPSLATSEKFVSKVDLSTFDLGMMTAKDLNKSMPANMAPITNTLSVNIQNMDASAIQFAAKVQMDTKQGTDALAQQLNDIIRDKVDIQISAKKQSATIRLDPPELGKLELKVRVDGDKLFVTVNANHTQTRDAVSQGLDKLRADLNFNGQISVDIGSLPNENPNNTEKYQDQNLASMVSNNKETDLTEHSEQDVNTANKPQHFHHAAIARI